ncbi:MAG: TIGR03862 family flavoprotein [Saprospiraceae bacterium]|nr:TIGR03862 family flavoprotein [Saprospiraceae bacterium]MDG1436027.1 TIGR03862 family flavoprotein [Saprospiraceae bacterium]MDG2418779.1 TIGR03862 family flavoprotein [Saprospiraceae bacterium]
MAKKKIIIIGGGAAGMMAAERFCNDFEIAIYEKGKTIGRKFLVAGNGGFNLTNKVEKEDLTQYYRSHNFLKKAILDNDSSKMRIWLSNLGIPTFIGTSGRIFPEKGIKPVQVLKSIRDRLIEKGVIIFTHHKFIGFDEKCNCIVEHNNSEITLSADYFIFSLGGASWSKTGSDGTWTTTFEKIGVKTIPFQASNCGLNIEWSDHFKIHHAGKHLKNIKISIDRFEIKGEATITDYGLEGNAIYPLIWKVRESFSKGDTPKISIDFKPLNPREQLLDKIKNKAQRTKTFALSLNLNSTQIALIKSFSDKKYFLEPSVFITNVKQLQIPIHSLRPMEEAISTVGGIDINEVNANFSLKKNPSIFVIGEMLDWDAPTGGFLLQGCFSMAHAIEIK